MSFGTIFSIFIIIFIIAVAFFAIRHFLNLSKCTNVGLFYDDIENKVKGAWSATSGRYQDEFTAKIPRSGLFGTGVEYVCFGKLSSSTGLGSEDERRKNSLIDDYDYDPQGNYNLFMYPPDAGCDASLGATNIKCGTADCMNTKTTGGSDQFFCVPVEKDGSVKVWISKESTDYQVSLRPQL